MQTLEIKTNENGEYIEYKGVVLPLEHTGQKQYGKYDFFDMKPSAPSEYKDVFKVGDFTQEIVSDSDNLAHNFEFCAKDIDETHFEIVMTYYLSRGGNQECVIGEVSL